MTITTVKKPISNQGDSVAPTVSHVVDKGDVVNIPVWDQAMDRQTQASVDRVLDYMIRHGIRPRIQANGDVLSVATKIIRDMQAVIPDTMHDDMNVMLDHLMQWICDYADHTQTKTMRIRFGFEEGQKMS